MFEQEENIQHMVIDKITKDPNIISKRAPEMKVFVQ